MKKNFHDAMITVRIYPNPFAKESSTFQEELTRMVNEGQEFPCYFTSRYNAGSASSHPAATMEDQTPYNTYFMHRA
jgi:hypothetical protein